MIDSARTELFYVRPAHRSHPRGSELDLSRLPLAVLLHIERHTATPMLRLALFRCRSRQALGYGSVVTLLAHHPSYVALGVASRIAGIGTSFYFPTVAKPGDGRSRPPRPASRSAPTARSASSPGSAAVQPTGGHNKRRFARRRHGHIKELPHIRSARSGPSLEPASRRVDHSSADAQHRHIGRDRTQVFLPVRGNRRRDRHTHSGAIG